MGNAVRSSGSDDPSSRIPVKLRVHNNCAIAQLLSNAVLAVNPAPWASAQTMRRGVSHSQRGLVALDRARADAGATRISRGNEITRGKGCRRKFGTEEISIDQKSLPKFGH
jgi:hypothetical protein